MKIAILFLLTFFYFFMEILFLSQNLFFSFLFLFPSFFLIAFDRYQLSNFKRDGRKNLYKGFVCELIMEFVGYHINDTWRYYD